MLLAALAYVERLRFAVFPCQLRGKTPLTEHGFKDATKDPDKIRRFWAAWPDANIGVATGAASGIVVLDVDPRHGGDEALVALEAERGKLPEVPTVLTGGGGTQLYFRHPGNNVRNSVGLIGLGLDVRADGGYVIAPPSIHPSGRRYYWKASSRIDEIPTADAPAWLLTVIGASPQTRRPPTGGRNQLSSRFDFARLAAGLNQGQRDMGLFQLACWLRRRGFSRGFVENAVLDAARRCKPPFPERTARSKVASAWRYQR
jgi:hypothetical protein